MNLCSLCAAKDKNPEAVTLPPYFDDEYDDGDCDDEGKKRWGDNLD